MEQHGAELVELDEILGYHLEQACNYRAELGLPFDDELAAAAGGASSPPATARSSVLITAPPRASSSGPLRSCQPGEIDLGIEIEIIDALLLGRRPRGRVPAAEALTARGTALGDEVAELSARIQAGFLASRRNRPSRWSRSSSRHSDLRGGRGRRGAVHRLPRTRVRRVPARADGRCARGIRACGYACSSGGLPHESSAGGRCAVRRKHARVGAPRMARRERAAGGRDHWFRGSRATGARDARSL